MLGKCFRSWNESIRGLNTLWGRDWSFPPRPGRDGSKRSSIHHPPGLLARYSLFGGFLSLVSSVSLAQDPATVGQCSSVMTWPYIATHAQVLPTGKVLWWPPFGDGDNPTLWDPATNTNTAAPRVGANIFCSGHAFLPDGQLLVAGGHVDIYMGLPNAYTYDPFNNTWTRLPDMNYGRWYPTSTTLPNGDALVISG